MDVKKNKCKRCTGCLVRKRIKYELITRSRKHQTRHDKCGMANVSFIVKNAKNAVIEAYAMQHLLYLFMATWVSKDVSGPQECRQMPLSNF